MVHEDVMKNITLASQRQKKERKVGDLQIISLTKLPAQITIMPLPKLSMGKQPCGGHYRQGSSCMFTAATCKFDHTPLESLPLTSKQEWYDYVITQSN